jgi:hypothetical protein
MFVQLGILCISALLLCTPVPRSARVLAEFQLLYPCPSTGLRTGTCPGYIRDHIKPLCLTGKAGDVVENLQWQTIHDAKLKDIQEREECRIAGCQHRGD